MTSSFARRRRNALATTAAGALALTALAGSPASAEEGPEQLKNGSFTNGGDAQPWYAYGVASQGVTNGEFCVTTNAGTVNPWDAAIGHNGVPIVAGETYAFTFKARASSDVTIRANVQRGDGDYAQALGASPTVTTQAQTFRYTFTPTFSESESGQVAFQIGGQGAFDLCLDDISLRGGAAPDVYKPDTASRVRVNQVGYLPNAPKRATLVTDATAGVPWELKRDGTVVKSGTTTPRGLDKSSNQNVHVIDFSGVTAQGTGYTLEADGETSFPFDIDAKAYEKLRVDSLSFFYPQRSGVEIKGAVAGEKYARPAGHVSSPGAGSANKGDYNVPCQSVANQTNDAGQSYYPEGRWSCPAGYKLDVTGGWYDAGDHGKYVVNGGISVAQVMSTFERTKTAATADAGALANDTLRVPEGANGVPDVLDEARFELEWMLKMQVPAATPDFNVGGKQIDLQGLVHHKIHDEGWTGLPLMPHLDPQVRSLHRPSTAATLNFAAVAAQGSRLFAPYDRDFAKKLLAQAEVAWAAAMRVPNLHAPGADGAEGGGPYNDSNVSDESYWAAAELYITTGQDRYLTALTRSPHHTGNVFADSGFDWGSVAALGRLDLATVKNNLPLVELARVRQSVVSAADRHISLQKSQAYGQPYAPADNEYGWGSNSQILNNIVVLATAHDITGDKKYADAAVEGMDYILGRNALNQSYITGYGEKDSRNQHSRWYAHQLKPELPNPPAGTVAGGPNSLESTWDPKAQEKLKGCAPQFCYIDDIDSWSTNELTVNWNSALAWVASYVADQDNG